MENIILTRKYEQNPLCDRLCSDSLVIKNLHSSQLLCPLTLQLKTFLRESSLFSLSVKTIFSIDLLSKAKILCLKADNSCTR